MNIGGGTAPLTVEIGGDSGNPLTTDMNIGGGAAPVTVEVGGAPGSPLTTDMNIGGTNTPLSTDITLHTPDIIRTSSDINSRMSVDLKPVVVDMCTTVNFGRVPEMCVRQPYEARYCITLFGAEIMALEFRGENRTYTENMPSRPAVVGPPWGHDPHDGPGNAGHGNGNDAADGDGSGLVISV